MPFIPPAVPQTLKMMGTFCFQKCTQILSLTASFPFLAAGSLNSWEGAENKKLSLLLPTQTASCFVSSLLSAVICRSVWVFFQLVSSVLWDKGNQN